VFAFFSAYIGALDIEQCVIVYFIENGRLSDRYHIKSYRLLLYRPILRASLLVEQPLTGRITQQIKGH